MNGYTACADDRTFAHSRGAYSLAYLTGCGTKPVQRALHCDCWTGLCLSLNRVSGSTINWSSWPDVGGHDERAGRAVVNSVTGDLSRVVDGDAFDIGPPCPTGVQNRLQRIDLAAEPDHRYSPIDGACATGVSAIANDLAEIVDCPSPAMCCSRQHGQSRWGGQEDFNCSSVNY